MEAMFYGIDVTDMSIRQINQLFRKHDESRKWPICGQFNATERAIRHLRKIMRCNGENGGFEYAYMLDEEIGFIVNGENLNGSLRRIQGKPQEMDAALCRTGTPV